ncbi:MAG: hypothetical protein IJP62_06080 [Treponema sp.]|nr:hypothetical protein [Treponema sp.]
MTDTQQFLSEAKKIIKHERADNGGRYDAKRACEKIVRMMESRNSALGDLPHSVGDFWLSTYILPSANMANEPTDDNLRRLTAFNAFLSGEDDEADCLTADDWNQLQELVNYEAEDLPLDDLEKMMGIIVEKGAL